MIYKLNSNICQMFADAPSLNTANTILCIGNVTEKQVRNELYESLPLHYTQFKTMDIRIVNLEALVAQVDKRSVAFDLQEKLQKVDNKPWAILSNDEVLSLTTLTVYKMVDKGLRECTHLTPISEGQLKDVLAKH